MIDFDNVQIKNAMNVAFLCCKNDLGIKLKPVYFKVGYKSEIGEIGANQYVTEGDGGGYPRIVVNILENVKLSKDGFVELSCNVIVADTYLRDEKGGSVEKSDVEGYGDLYEVAAKFWGYLHGMKHKKFGTDIPTRCFKMEGMMMENDGYKIADEILVVDAKFSMFVGKPKNWECQLKNWSDGSLPSFLNGKYDPNADKPFPSYDIEKYVK